MKSYIVTAIWGLFIWLFATLFFVFFGDRVLFPPGTEEFMISLLLLLIGTALLLWLVTYLYLLVDKSENAAIKFGIIGTMLGLALDTFSLANHQLLFPKLSYQQVIAFTAWLTFAYAIYLFIPAIMNLQKRKALKP